MPSKSAAAAKQMCPGFQAPANIANLSGRAMLTLTALRKKIVERTEEVETAANTMFASTLQETKERPAPGVFDAWTFTLGLKEAGDVRVPIEGDIVDIISVGAIEEIVKDLEQEGVTKTYDVSITDIRQIDNYTLVITVNVLGA